MRVSQRLDYALRALTALAQQPEGRPMVAGDLARDLGLPKRFLEQQITALGKRGLVSCQRGASGGCVLARSPDLVTVADVVRAVQGEVLDVPHRTGSASSEMWLDVARALEDVLGSVTLRQLAKRQTELDAAAVPMYYI
ncbi:MAG TPA: Rrf2 family transcriptional regulator [Coriobacteriia bacterium]